MNAATSTIETGRAFAPALPMPTGLSGPLISTQDLTRSAFGARIDPFLIVSRFDMLGPVFPPHPHAGFAVLTYILPESETGFRNQDSTGVSNVVAPGEMHVAMAGRGLLHEETNVQDGRHALGFQVWIDLPASHRQDAPFAQHLKGEAVPVVRWAGMMARVMMGSSQGAVSPVTLPTAIRLVDVTLEAGLRFSQDLNPSETAFLVMLGGEVETTTRTAQAGEVLFTEPGHSSLDLRAGSEGARFVLFAGAPLGQAPVMGGPFVATDAAELRAFKQAYAAGEMGSLVAFSDH